MSLTVGYVHSDPQLISGCVSSPMQDMEYFRGKVLSQLRASMVE